MLRYLLIFLVIAALAVFASLQFPRTMPTGFSTISEYNIDGNAEIVQAAGDGNYLVYNNPDRSSVDIIDIRDPESPTRSKRIALPGIPTSVGASPDGNWAFVTVFPHARDEGDTPVSPLLPALLALIDLRDPEEAAVVTMIGIGHQPDGLAVTASGSEIVAVVAVENKAVRVSNDKISDDSDATDISLPGLIQMIAIDPAKPNRYTVTNVELTEDLLRNSLMLLPEDPQPESVAISPGKHLAAVSLQDNNGIVLVEHATGEIISAFSLGTVSSRLADLRDDDQILLEQNYPEDADNPLAGTRFPDGISFTPDGQYLLSADEGQRAMTGGRGFSVWSLEGEFIWDDGGEIEAKAVELGFYDDGRSDNRGVEIEGIAAARFGDSDYAFAVAEHASFMVIYDISNPRAPFYVDMLRVGREPVSVVAIPGRDLVAVASEKGSTLTIFGHAGSTEPTGPTGPTDDI